MTKRDKMLDKARKCLALAASANENEAAVAMLRVHSICAAYHIRLDEVKAPTIADLDQPMDEDDSWVIETAAWKQAICNGCAKLYFCGYLVKHGHLAGRGKTVFDQHIFIGLPHNIAVAQMMAVYLIETIERLAKDATAKYSLGEGAPSPALCKTFADSFRAAAAARMYSRMMARIEDAIKGRALPEEGDRNLPVLWDDYAMAQADVNEWNKRKGRSLELAPGFEARHKAGTTSGRKAADDISLDTQVGNTPTTQIG